MKAKEKRQVRGYKCAGTPYKKAMRRAEKEKSPLATFLEKVVVSYSEGCQIVIIPPIPDKGETIKT